MKTTRLVSDINRDAAAKRVTEQPVVQDGPAAMANQPTVKAASTYQKKAEQRRRANQRYADMAARIKDEEKYEKSDDQQVGYSAGAKWAEELATHQMLKAIPTVFYHLSSQAEDRDREHALTWCMHHYLEGILNISQTSRTRRQCNYDALSRYYSKECLFGFLRGANDMFKRAKKKIDEKF